MNTYRTLPETPPIRRRVVLQFWWPLAASWLLMGCELPLVSAVMARLPNPTVSLAAYGGVVFPLALLIESPIIMLLSASTALSRDRQAYQLIRRFMLVTAFGLMALHALVAFTPLFFLVVGKLLHAPREVLGPARTGLRIMLPWTISIAYRRFQHGVLIRSGRSKAVGIGTAVRLGANALVLAIGYALGAWPGIVVGTLAIACGVVSEAVYAGIVVRPALRELAPGPLAGGDGPLTFRAFLRFYVPLAMTPLIMLAGMPLATGAMSRMPRPLESLAVWPVLSGLVFMLRSVGFALNEVVVALLERPGSVVPLRRFALGLAATTSAALLVVAATPLGRWWFSSVSALPAPLATLAGSGLWLALLLPGLSALQSYYQGALVHARRTRGVSESVVVSLVAAGIVLFAGIAWSRAVGLYVGVLSLLAANAAQLAWLWLRGRPALRELEERHRQGLMDSVEDTRARVLAVVPGADIP